jgi:epoxide hydrolase-like predicted phosphatase
MADSGNGTRRYRGLLVDWGGVLTTNLFDSFRAFCEAQGLEPEALRQAFRHDASARGLLIELEEGRIEESAFEPELAKLLGCSEVGLIDGLFAGSGLDQPMVEAVRRAHGAGIATGLVSNSWGTRRYPRELLGELFDAIVISGEVGMRKPAPRMYELGAERLGLPAEECVFVDDLPFNLDPARELGMATVHHVDAVTTVAELERLLGVALA